MSDSSFDSTFKIDENRPWLKEGSRWSHNMPKQLDFPVTTMANVVAGHAAKIPHAKAVNFLDCWYTYSQLDDYANRLAAGLSKNGLKKGDVLALLLPNSMQYIVSYLAAQKIGVIITGCNPTYKPIEILHQLRVTAAKAILYLDALWEKELEPIAKDITDMTKICCNIGDFLPAPKRFFGKLLGKIPQAEPAAGSLSFSELLACKDPVPAVEIDPYKDIAIYLMTGGSTGFPKAAQLTYFNIVSNAMQIRTGTYKVDVGTGFIGVLPFFHAFAMTTSLNLPLMAGAWILLFPKPPKVEPLCAALHKYNKFVSNEYVYCGVEVLFQRLGEFEGSAKYDLSKLGLCVCGAGALHDYARRAFESRFPQARLVEGYGLTEASPVVTAGLFYEPANNKDGSIGMPLLATDCKIVDIETGEQELPLGPDNVGELIVHGPQVMAGYLHQEEEDRDIRVINGERWLFTGDLGYMDEDGYIFLCDRKKQLIKHKGYSIFPREIETLVGQHPAIKEVAAAGIPDKQTNEVVKVWVVLKEEFVGKITSEELIDWCKQNLSHYKVPRYIEFRNELPVNAVGKVQRRALQENDPLYIEAVKK